MVQVSAKAALGIFETMGANNYPSLGATPLNGSSCDSVKFRGIVGASFSSGSLSTLVEEYLPAISHASAIPTNTANAIGACCASHSISILPT